MVCDRFWLRCHARGAGLYSVHDMKPLNVLIGCECSGVVREAFRALGHDAWSCDLKPAEDNSRFHYRCDIFRAIRRGGWNMAIFHPPCDYLANCAAWAFPDPDYARYPNVGYHQKVKPATLTGKARRDARERATEFFLALWNCGIPHIAIENPIGCMNTHPLLPCVPPGRQIIQPYQFGDDASKATCLWLKGFPPLTGTKYVEPRAVCTSCGADAVKIHPRWSNQTDSGQNRLSPSDDRAAARAVTYPGIARAMAVQWSQHVETQPGATTP